jgi:hypothetical protein
MPKPPPSLTPVGQVILVSPLPADQALSPWSARGDLHVRQVTINPAARVPFPTGDSFADVANWMQDNDIQIISDALIGADKRRRVIIGVSA